jgi:TonB family protein
MFCGACGKQLEEEAVFCGECGAKVQPAPTAPETSRDRYTGYDQDATLLLPQEPEDEGPAAAANREKPEKSGGAWWKYAVLLALLLILCGIGGWYVVRYLASLRSAQPVAALPTPAPEAVVAPAEPARAPVEVPKPAARPRAPKPVKKSGPKKEPVKSAPAPKPVIDVAANVPTKAAEPAPPPVSAPPSTAAASGKREPLRVGGSVQESKLIRRIAPAYPELAKRSRAEGTVILEVNVDAGGNVTAVRVVRGHPLLNDEAVRAVKQWKYSPTLLNGEAVPVIANVTVVFKLN